MTLLFDDTKKLEKAVGEEATKAILNIVENAKGEAATGAATKEDLAKVEGSIRTDIARLDGKIDKLQMQVRLLIALTALAVAFFSPVAEKLVGFIR